VVLLRGYIDESYDSQVFTLACLSGFKSKWIWVAKEWSKCLRNWNQRLKRQGRKRISRYHATDCSNRLGDFEGWSLEEQKEFTSDLFKSFSDPKRPLDIIAFSVNMSEFREVFAGYEKLLKPDAPGFLYAALLRLIMFEMESRYCSVRPDIRISLIHDRCSYDAELLRVFNQMIGWEKFEAAKCFVTIAPMGWEECIPLQPADMLAYENFKEMQRGIAGRNRRKSLEILLELGPFGGRAKYLNKGNLLKLRDGMIEFQAQTQ
jgi:hypothetical protein